MLKRISRRLRFLSLSTDYYIFLVFIFLAIVCFSVFYYYRAYDNFNSKQKREVTIAAFKIQDEFSEILRENSNLLKYIGAAITKKNLPPKKMLEDIANKLAAPAHLDMRSLMAATYISWADPTGKVLVSGKHGVLIQEHPNISQRDYFETARQEPWALKTALPSRSLFSNNLVLPVTMGVEKADKKFLGYLVLGLRVKNIYSHLGKVIDKRKIGFILIDQNKNIILSSSGLNIDKSSFNSLFFLGNKKEGYLKNPVKINNYSFSYYKKIRNYPYIVITGYNQEIKDAKFNNKVLPSLYQFLILGFLCIIFIVFFKRIVINPIASLSNYAVLISNSNGKTPIKLPKQYSLEMYNLAKGLLLVNRYIQRSSRYQQRLELAEKIAHSSDDAKEEYLKSLKKDFSHPLKTILNYTDLLLNNTTKSNGINLDDAQLLKCLNKIKSAALQINYKAFSSLELTFFDMNELLDQCVQINLKDAFSKKINIITSFQEKLPPIYADRLKIKQIIVGIIYQSIKNLPSSRELNIGSQSFMEKGVEYIETSIKDNGFGLDEEEIHRIEYNLGIDEETPFLDVGSLGPELIRKIIEMHGGKYYFHSKLHEGSSIHIILPVYAQRENSPSLPLERNKNLSNIHYLT